MANELGPVWRILSVLSLAGCAATQSSFDLDGIGRAVASNLDSGNGFPTAVLDEYRCREAPCRNREGHVPASLADASTLVFDFAEVLGIPVKHYDGYGGPRCEWREASDASPVGLWAEFMEPDIQGDSARVELATVCGGEGRAFEQIHEFVLKTDGRGGWEVVSRRLLSIT